MLADPGGHRCYLILSVLSPVWSPKGEAMKSAHFAMIKWYDRAMRHISGWGFHPHSNKGQWWNKAVVPSAIAPLPPEWNSNPPHSHFDLFINMVTSHNTTGLCWLNHVVYGPLSKQITQYHFKHNRSHLPRKIWWDSPPQGQYTYHYTLCVSKHWHINSQSLEIIIKKTQIGLNQLLKKVHGHGGIPHVLYLGNTVPCSHTHQSTHIVG